KNKKKNIWKRSWQVHFFIHVIKQNKNFVKEIIILNHSNYNIFNSFLDQSCLKVNGVKSSPIRTFFKILFQKKFKIS
ncbi:hypothetical protein BpHYR1_007051, partial [Brachionus plicatilis]